MKSLDQYEPELRASIKRIQKLNKDIEKLHWCSREMPDDYFIRKFGEKLVKWDLTQN